MAEKILEDVLNNFLNIDTLLTWLSTQNAVTDVNNYMIQYNCNQVEFVSYFLNFLREHSSSLLQSSCSIETPCKDSQLRNCKSLNYSTEKSTTDRKSDCSRESTGRKIDIKSLDSFPALSEVSNKTRSKGKSVTKQSDCPSTTNSENFRRIELFPGKKDATSPIVQDNSVSCASFENHSPVTISTPKSTGKESIDIAEYFSDVVCLDSSSDWSPGFVKKRDKGGGQNCARANPSMKSRSLNESTPNQRRKHSKTPNLMLGDFIMNDVNRKDKGNVVRRRINPTRMTNSSPQFEGGSYFENSSSLVENESSSIADDRLMMRMECANLMEQLEGEKKSDFMNVSVPTRVFSTPSKKVTLADLCSATCLEELKKLAIIYSRVIDENYCQNIMMELCFVVSLLVIQNHSSPEPENNVLPRSGKRKLLDTIHNCVFFAVETLSLQRNLLILLNLAALKLLSDNVEIKKFNPDLNLFLTRAYTERQEKEAMQRQLWDGKTPKQGNVSFECETDNKENFTNVPNFHSFRKQRDLFYNILEIWEENHLTSGWGFSKLHTKIKSLLSICSDPTNLLHLARLFRCQLVMSCCNDCLAEEEYDEEILQLLASVDPNKILRLRARLRNTRKRQGPCPQPEFTGNQEFFKDFILSTSHTFFHYYLKNSLCDEILRLNELEFSGDLEEDESCLDQQTQSRYLQEINILCLLAKFLGFLEFLPYRTDEQWSDRVLSVHCAARQNALPLFDLETCLNTAVIRHKLTYTLPWMMNYLSMMDTCSARLSAYQKVWKILIHIYWKLKSWKNSMNSFYLRLVLGWFFQLPNFPSDFFYSVVEEINTGHSIDLQIEFKTGLDSYNFIEENILYSVCPYLSEINSILTENSGCGVRHVRPVSQGNNFSSQQLAKQLELRLEESFLHGQSSSTRRTIDFVTERVSSVAVKYLISDVIPKVKEKALVKLNGVLENCKDNGQEIDAISAECHAELTKECETEYWRLCIARSEKAVAALLSLDVDAAVSKTCIQITARQSAEKVKRWMETHVTPDVIRKEFAEIASKNAKKQTETVDGTVENCPTGNDDFLLDVENRSVSYVLITLRELMWSVHEGEGIVWTEIDSILQMAGTVLENSRQIFPTLEKTLLSILLDLIIIICVKYESEFKRENFTHLFNLMRKLGEVKNAGNSLERIICPRNVALLMRDSNNRGLSWENLGNIFLFLKDEGFLNPDEIETQLVSLFKNNWGKTESELFTKLFNQILRNHRDRNGCDQFTLLLEYLIETIACDNDDTLLH